MLLVARGMYFDRFLTFYSLFHDAVTNILWSNQLHEHFVIN